jgi:hypothetical protein
MNSKSNFKMIPAQARVAIICFGVAGLLVALGSIFTSHQWPVAQSLVLVALSIATARTKVRLTETATISCLTSTVLLSLMVAGTGLAVIAGICGVVTQNVLPSRKLVFHQLAFNAGMIALTAGASGLAFHLLIGHTAAGFAEHFLASIMASLIYFFLNSSSIALIIGLSKRMSALEVWRKNMVSTTPSFMLAGMLSLALFRAFLTPAAGLMLATLPVMACVYYVSVWLSRHPMQKAS